MKRALLGFALAAAMLVAAPFGHAVVINFIAHMDGASEFPPNPSLGTGLARVRFDTVSHLMDVHAEFSGLTGTTTVAHIHCCTAAPFDILLTAGVATTTPTFPGFPAGVTSGTYDATFDMLALSSYNPAFVAANGGTAASAEAVLLDGMIDGTSYFNIHTSFRGGGEIRGFLVAIPEPATLGLLALGLGAGLVSRRRKRI